MQSQLSGTRRITMRKLAAMLCAAAIVALPAVAMTATGEPASAPHRQGGKMVAETMVAENATVEAIDMNTRTVTLRLSDGRKQALVVDKAVKKLGQVKVGDTVRTRYREAVSVKISKVKVKPGLNVEATVTPDEKSVKPSGTADVRVTAIATIDRIYDDGKKATLRMPNGNTVDVEVRDPENREKIKKGEVKPGDQVEITYLRAVALSVEKAAGK